MRRIAVINQKGGVGKTTTTANLGAALAAQGLRVLLTDLDPQGHLTLHFGVELSDEDLSVYDVLTASAPIGKVLRPVRERVTVIPSDIDLAAAEAELISVTGREVILCEALEPIRKDFDVMLIDCPPSLGVLTINALAASDEVMIPLQAHFFALQGLSKLLDTVTLVRKRINPRLRVGGVVLCMHDASTKLASEVSEDLNRFLESGRAADHAWSTAKLYQTPIRRNIKLAESPSFGQTVFDYAPRSHGALDYGKLADEVIAEMTVKAPPVVRAAPRIEPTQEIIREKVAAATVEPAPVARKPRQVKAPRDVAGDASSPQPMQTPVAVGAGP